MNQKKTLTLNLSELSPTMCDKLVERICDVLKTEAEGILYSVHNFGYSEGEVKKEMIKWAGAATTLVYDIHKQVRDYEGK